MPLMHFATCKMAAPTKRQRNLKSFFLPKSAANGNVEKKSSNTECPELGSETSTSFAPSTTSVRTDAVLGTTAASVIDSDLNSPPSNDAGHQTSTIVCTELGSAPPASSSSTASSKPGASVIWSAEQMSSQIDDIWPSEKVHCYFTCKTSDCCSLNQQEQIRLQTIEASKKMEKKKRFKPDRFRHEWLNKKNWPICYVEGKGFYCILCKKHRMKNIQNNSQTFVENPSVRLKEDALKKHLLASVHSAAVEADLMQRLSVFHRTYVERNEVETEALQSVFATCYFLMKELIANRKLLPLIQFMEKVLGLSQFRHFNHRSEGSIQEIFLTLGNSVKENLVQRVKQAKVFGLMIDEVTDISVSSQLVTFIQYWDHEESAVHTAFLSTQNVLEHFESCNAEAIYNLVLDQLQECGIQVDKLMGLSTDGARVMLGSVNGVAARLRRLNPKLLNIHCICHRLALACTDSCNDLKYLKKVEDTLRQLWYLFQNSPKKMACFLKCQLALKNVNLINPAKSEKFLSRRLKKACQTRWLSFGASVTAAIRDYEAILLTLQKLDDATATGLLHIMKHVKFLGTLYILNAILPILSRLSQQFQASKIHFSMIAPSVTRVLNEIDEIRKDKRPLEKLQSDIESYTNLSEELAITVNTGKELDNLLSKYCDALCTNMKGRLGQTEDVISAYGVFDPHSLPNENLGQYGEMEMTTLGKHFFPDNVEKQIKLMSQWTQTKFFLAQKSLQVPTGCKSSTYLMSFMLRNDGIFHPNLFEEILYVVEVGLALPCSNAWPERGASILKLTKSKSRNRLSDSMLNSLMHASINGPNPNDSQSLIHAAVSTWLGTKTRKKLKRKRTSIAVSEELTNEVEVLNASPENCELSDREQNDISAAASALSLPECDDSCGSSDEESEMDF